MLPGEKYVDWYSLLHHSEEINNTYTNIILTVISQMNFEGTETGNTTEENSSVFFLIPMC